MRSRTLIGLILLLVLLPLSAQAEDFTSCWVAVDIHPIYGTETQITRCRINGGNTVDYASDTDVPSVLYPNVGNDATGQCWYLTSATTAYLILNRYADGSIDVGLDPDPSDPNAIIALGPRLPRCTSEPIAADPAGDAWDYAMSYVHAPPTPDLNPVPGEGLTGLDTFLGLAIPANHNASLTSGTTTLDVSIEVAAIVVDWGDGQIDTYPALEQVMAGYPDGGARHVYEVKDSNGAAITVEYDWNARWRPAGGSWTALPVPNTATTVDYPIAEVVSRLRD